MKSNEQSQVRRLGVASIDQAISGASNFLITLLAAQILGIEAFGLFGITMLVYIVVVGVARALISEPLLLHPVEAEERSSDAISSASVLGTALGLLVLGSGIAARPWDDRLGDGLIVLGLFVPFLVLHDVGRYLGFSTRRPAAALALDVTWLLLQIGAVTALVVLDVDSLPIYVAAWAGSGAFAGLLVFWQHAQDKTGFNISWLRESWSYSWRYLISYTSTQGSGLLAAILLTAIAGTRALGGVQGALLLLRPFMTLQVAVVANGVGEVARIANDRLQVRRLVRKLTVLTGGVALLNAVVIVLLPDQWGVALLGDTWQVTQHLVWPAAVQITALGLTTGYRTGMLGMRAIDKAVVIDVLTTMLVLILSTIGALVGGAEPAMWGTSIATTTGLVMWIVVFQNYLRRDLGESVSPT